MRSFDLEHVISCVASLIRNCSGANRQRVFNKFTENDHEKVMIFFILFEFEIEN